MNRPVRVAVLLLVLAVVGSGPRAPWALAHEGEGVLTVESQEAAPGGSVRYQVRLTWANDGHAAIDATVTATPIAPDGTPGTPVVLDPVDQDGRYAGIVPFDASGAWTVRFTSITPAATSELVEEVALPVPTTVPATTPTTSATTSTEAVDLDDSSEEAASSADDDDGGGSLGVLAIGALVLLVVGVAVGFTRSNRRLRDGP